MNKEEYKAGLWKKKSKSGITYCSGKIKIGANEYYITLFNNDKKGNEKAPDFNIIMRDSVISQEKQENALNEPKNSVKNATRNAYKTLVAIKPFFSLMHTTPILYTIIKNI